VGMEGYVLATLYLAHAPARTRLRHIGTAETYPAITLIPPSRGGRNQHGVG
jgi:hypothetical protein